MVDKDSEAPDSTETRAEIVGKVAAVTSDRELVINRGSNHGVAVGMVFLVKGAPIEIRDPDTQEPIGKVSNAKVLVRVTQVDEELSIARTFRSRTVNVGGNFVTGGSLASFLQPPKYEHRVETLKRSQDDGLPIAAGDSLVKRGDIVEESSDSEDFGVTTVWRPFGSE